MVQTGYSSIVLYYQLLLLLMNGCLGVKCFHYHNWQFLKYFFAGSQREELCPWQRSWGRRLRHTQRRNRASGNPLFPSIYPQNQSLLTLLFYALTYTSDFAGGWPHTTSLGEGVNLQLQLIKIPGRVKSVSTYKLLWRFSSLPEQFRPATCDCSQPPNRERHKMP